MEIKISPSILASDISNLQAAIGSVDNADEVHVDVMDGHFVPNLTWGVPIAKAVADMNVMPTDVHLMIENPDRWAVDYADAGADTVTFHAEAATAPITLARNIRKAGARAGLAFKPGTKVDAYLPYLDEFDMALVMTVEPGFGGQTFLEPELDTVRKIRRYADENKLDLDIQVDGGINRETIARVAQAGANVFVAGSSVYGSEDPKAEVDALREIAASNYGTDQTLA